MQLKNKHLKPIYQACVTNIGNCTTCTFLLHLTRKQFIDN